MDLPQLSQEIEELRGRNRRVETDKAWETSLTRRLLLMLFTYLAVGSYLAAIGINQPWRNAIVPSLAFLLSTLTLPFFRNLWQRYFHKN